MRKNKFLQISIGLIAAMAILTTQGFAYTTTGDGIETVAIEANYGSTTTILDPTNAKVNIEQNSQTKISITFVGTEGGTFNYLIRAPWAKAVISTQGKVKNDPKSTVLTIDTKKDQSFRLEFHGTAVRDSYIDIFRVDNEESSVIAHVEISVINPNPTTTPKTEKEEKKELYGKLTSQISTAEQSLNEATAKGLDKPILKSKLETAKLYAEDGKYENAIPLIDEITESSSAYLEQYSAIENRIEYVKSEAIKQNRISFVSEDITSAEIALKEGDLESANKFISAAEEKINPNLLDKIIEYKYTKYIILVLGMLVLAIFAYRKIFKRGTLTGINI
ncbi:MAG: hypothetical protein ACE5KT_00435 [Methanosarcinales archaeon]